MFKKLLASMSVLLITVSSTSTFLNTNKAKNDIEHKIYDLPNNSKMSDVSEKLNNFFASENEFSGSYEKTYKFNQKSSSNLVFDNIFYNKYQNSLDINLENLVKMGLNEDLIDLLDSNEFYSEINKAYQRGIFVYDFNSEKIYYNDELNQGLDKFNELDLNLDDKNTSEVKNDTNNLRKVENKFLGNNFSISNSDFWTESHWYWFGFKIFQMTNKGRLWLVNKSGILTLTGFYNSLKSLGKLIAKNLIYHAKMSGGNIYVFIFKVVLLVVNVILIASCMLKLKSWNNTGASIKYFSLSGTIVWWNKR